MQSGTKEALLPSQDRGTEAGKTPRLGRNLLYQLWAEPTGISGSCGNVMFSPHHTQALVLGQGSKLLMQGTLQPFPDQQRQFPGSRGFLVAFPDLADEQHSTCQQPLSKPSQNSIIDLQCPLLFPASHWKQHKALHLLGSAAYRHSRKVPWDSSHGRDRWALPDLYRHSLSLCLLKQPPPILLKTEPQGYCLGAVSSIDTHDHAVSSRPVASGVAIPPALDLFSQQLLGHGLQKHQSS